MKKVLIVFVLCLFVLVACAPSVEAVNTAIAETQAAAPTSTSTIAPTATVAPTQTPQPTATTQPTATPDLRVIDIDPKKLLLDKSDLPADGKYRLPGPGWISPSTNAEVISARTIEEGQAYISETGRVHGWYIYYARGTNSAVLPDEISGNPILYSTSEGAQLLITKYANKPDGYRDIDAPTIGDGSRAYQVGDGAIDGNITLNLDFTYRNIFYSIELYGSEREVSLDLAVEIAKKVLAKLEELPLSDSVTFKP